MTSCAFEQVGRHRIDALKLDFVSYVHRATGARHFHLACEDTNNAFMVAFPTLPADSTGVAHILEHTTLCGSRHFPVRDPFFLMLRRSLNTYMNAFTSGDTTAYPFATQNRKDFSNLLAVYLDAVFFPTLDPLDFAQEGWRLDFKDPDDDTELVFKGVVYNEMKGAMSAPTAQLWEQVHEAIFRDTVYHYNSGGDPACIPDLSYESLKAFHARHYHPSQAVFMTYGNFPVAEHHEQFESLVFREFEGSSAPLEYPPQKRFPTPVESEACYAVTDPSEMSRSTHAVWSWLLGRTANPRSLLEAHLLEGLLLDHSGSPLRHYLETTSLAEAPSELCGLDDSGQELVFHCGVEGTDPEHVVTLEREIISVLQNVAAKGIDRETLTGVVDRMEMAQRDLGGNGYPYGLQLMGRVLPAAMFGSDPVALLDIDRELDELRKRIADPAYTRQLVADNLIENTHRVRTVMRPDDTKAERDRADEKARLDTILSAQDDAGKRAIRAAAARLAQRQDEPQNEDLLPKVTLADVPHALPEVKGVIEQRRSTPVHRYVAATNGLLYVQLVFELPALSRGELSEIPLFCEYLTELGCGAEDYAATQARRALLGSFGAYASARASVSDPAVLIGRFVVTAKSLNRKRAELVDSLFEVLDNVRFDEDDRLLDLLAQSRLDVEASITDRGHILAMQGAARNLSRGGSLDDLWEGPSSIIHVQSLDHAVERDSSALDELKASFAAIREKLLNAPPRILVVGEDEIAAEVMKQLEYSGPQARASATFDALALDAPIRQADCAWVTNTQVNFCAKAFPAVAEGHPDAPALAVLARYLSDGYLHPAIREKGGAYGAGAQFDVDSASFRFFSYRDPRLRETFDDFDNSIEWLAANHEPQRLEQSILGVIRGLDAPRTPAGSAIHAFYDELDGRTPEVRRAFRESVLATSLDDVQRVAERYLVPADSATAAVTHATHRSDLEKLALTEVKL